MEELVDDPSSLMEQDSVNDASISRSSSVATAQVRPNGTVVFTPPSQVKHAIAVPQPGGSLSIVHVSIPNNNQSTMHVQSVIQQPNQQSVIQAPGGNTGTTLQNLPKNVILLNKVTGQGSVIHSTDSDSGIHPVQLLSAKSDSDNETGNSLTSPEDESKKRREILARRPSYRKILSELSSTDGHTVTSLGGGGSSSGSSDMKDDGTATLIEDGEGGSTITVGGQQYHTSTNLLKVVPAGSIQLATQDGLQGIQTLTMGGGGGGQTGTIVQYAQGGDGQFFVPVTVSAADLQAYGIRTTGNGNSNITQGVVMTQSGNLQGTGPVVVEEASRKREMRLLKNREAAKECRRKKKEYIKCLENRVAVLENQNKALIEELKSLKELYCQKND